MRIVSPVGLIDQVSNAQAIILHEHHKIHAGNHFSAQCYAADVDVGQTFDRLIKAADRYCHLTFMIAASLAGLVEFYEGATTSDDGTLVDTFNNNRNSDNTATLLYYEDPTVTATGTRLLVNVLGTIGTNPSGAVGGNRERHHEFILKLNTNYLVRFTPAYNNTQVSCCLDWYE